MHYSRVNLIREPDGQYRFLNRYISDTACRFTIRKLAQRAKHQPMGFLWV